MGLQMRVLLISIVGIVVLYDYLGLIDVVGTFKAAIKKPTVIPETDEEPSE